MVYNNGGSSAYHGSTRVNCLTTALDLNWSVCLHTLSRLSTQTPLEWLPCVSVLQIQPLHGPNRKHHSSVDVVSCVPLQWNCLPGARLRGNISHSSDTVAWHHCCCREDVFTKILPCNGRLCSLTYSGFQRTCHSIIKASNVQHRRNAKQKHSSSFINTAADMQNRIT
jgi:hypothetical protein